MAFITDHGIYDALPIPGEVLDKGGVEMLRAGVVDEKLFVTARSAFADPAYWGYVLADMTRRLATLYAAEGEFAEAEVRAAIAGTFAASLRTPEAGAARKPVRRRTAKSAAKPARSRIKAPAKSKPSTKSVARRKGARAKP